MSLPRMMGSVLLSALAQLKKHLYTLKIISKMTAYFKVNLFLNPFVAPFFHLPYSLFLLIVSILVLTCPPPLVLPPTRAFPECQCLYSYVSHFSNSSDTFSRISSVFSFPHSSFTCLFLCDKCRAISKMKLYPYLSSLIE